MNFNEREADAPERSSTSGVTISSIIWMLVGLMFIFAVVRFLFGGLIFDYLYSHMGDENFYLLSKGAYLAIKSISIILTGGFIDELTFGFLGISSVIFDMSWNSELTTLGISIVPALLMLGILAIIKSALITKENVSVKRSFANRILFPITSAVCILSTPLLVVPGILSILGTYIEYRQRRKIT